MPKRKHDIFTEKVMEEFLDNDIPVKIKTQLVSDDEESDMDHNEIKIEPYEVLEMNDDSLSIEDQPLTRSIGIQTDAVCETNVNVQKVLNTLKAKHLVNSKLMVDKLFQSIEKVVEDCTKSINRKDAGLEDTTLVGLLTSWDLKHLLQFFQEQNITIKTLSLLTSNDLMEITQQMKIGDKILFKHNLEKWRKDRNLPVLLQQSTSEAQEAQSHYSGTEVENPKVNVLDILKLHKNGCKILKFYEKSQKISEEHRSCIMNIIVQHFESKDLHMSLQTSYQLENQILKIFPTEKLEYYRIERRGKIYSKYYNKKKLLKSLKTSESNSVTTKEDALVPEDDAEVYIHVLKTQDFRTQAYSLAWGSCVNYRLNQIRNECHNIKEVLKLWPEYKGPSACKFIECDFNGLYHKVATTVNWNEKFLKLFKYLKDHNNTREKSITDILTTIEVPQSDEDKDQPLLYLKLLWCLHSILFQTKKCARKNTNGKMEYGKFTIKDSQESFIYINSTMQSLKDHLAALAAKDDPIPPFILGLGDVNTLEIDKFFIYLDDKLIICDSFMEAFETCFKSFHVFNVSYPMASEPFWIFVENYFYGIFKNVKSYTKVCILLDQLSKM
ncbi:uncharacterized protein LOC119600512 isoform X2 [Lucilia sericata]|uniref:uncharacterized protein LOC119600512 isoform X2 n=1 Tax=Lucilia sericata TaxID=13632 RepID=UPI0018A80D9F|nr:uncharacterized protein LOC119600512 isoform X2 [Lucilia sericata]